jgi:hypothetical protein
MVSIKVAVIVSAVAMLMSVTALVRALREDRRRRNSDGSREKDLTITLDVNGERKVYPHVSPATYRKLLAMLSNNAEID